MDVELIPFRSSLVEALKLLPPERSAEAWAVLGQWDNLCAALALISGQPRETKARKMEIARRALDGRYV